MSSGKIARAAYTLKVMLVSIAAVLLVVFVLQNVGRTVKVSLVFREVPIALPWLVIGSAALGAVLTCAGMLLRRTHRKK